MKALRALLFLVGSAGALGGAAPPGAPLEAPPTGLRTAGGHPAWIRCSPVEIQPAGGAPEASPNPIADALDNAGPGTIIHLDPGDYPPFTIGFRSNSRANATTAGGVDGAPVVIQGTRGVRILGGTGDTIAIDQAVPNAWITFRDLTIVPGRRSGVLFFKRSDGRIHQGYSFENCHILGQFNHLNGQGKRAKWGVWGHRMSDFRFVGTAEPARIERIANEHAFYLQNPAGSILIENVHAKELGRTFCQFTARSQEGPPGAGDITVRNCVVEDACIADGDGYKGGSAFTIAGRLNGLILFEGNSYRAGFREKYRKLTKPGVPYGTGAFMAWEASPEGRNGTLILRDNDFRFAEGCGDRAVVSIGGCDRVLVVGDNRFDSGGEQAAIEFDPLTRRGRVKSTPNGRVYLAPRTRLQGKILVRGLLPTAEEREKLTRRGPIPKDQTDGPSSEDEQGK